MKTIIIKHYIAVFLFKLGFKPCSSWSIGDFPTRGYGKLDVSGHWEYEL